MRRIFIFREGNVMAALMGPNPQIGMSGYGTEIADALRDMAVQFDREKTLIHDNAVMVETMKRTETAKGASISDAIRKLAWIMAERGYTEHDFPELDWNRIAAEPPVAPTLH